MATKKKKIMSRIVGFAKDILMAKTPAKSKTKKAAPVKAKKAPAPAKKPAKVTAKAPEKAPEKAKVEVKAEKAIDKKVAVAKPTTPVKAAATAASKPPFETKKPEPVRTAAVAKVAPLKEKDEDEAPPKTIKPMLRSEDLFSQDELATFRTLLQTERKKILQKAKQAMESGNIHLDKDEMYDEVDLASATVEQNLTFRLLDRDRKLLAEVDHALTKLDHGDYGFCEGTGEPIPKRRLELRPWCRHSVKYKEQLERMEKSGRGVADEDEL